MEYPAPVGISTAKLSHQRLRNMMEMGWKHFKSQRTRNSAVRLALLEMKGKLNNTGASQDPTMTYQQTC